MSVMTIFSSPSFAAHEQVTTFFDSSCGLKAIVAQHNTVLGPALGGCRMWKYENEQNAIEDVLRLSKGMSYKNALAGIPFGGGKAVIIADSRTEKNEMMIKSFAKCLNALGGRYITAEDVGISEHDADLMATITPYVTGLSKKSGNPSPKTAFGTYLGIGVAVKERLGVDGLDGIRIAVQGLGAVGFELCRLLKQAGAKLYATDINIGNLKSAENRLGIEIIEPNKIFDIEVDVFSPCALGGIINENTIPRLKAKVVAGAANNQLENDNCGQILHHAKIMYAPDYVINAGGVINVASEVLRNENSDYTTRKINRIPITLRSIFSMSAKKNIGTNIIADQLAQDLINAQKENLNSSTEFQNV